MAFLETQAYVSAQMYLEQERHVSTRSEYYKGRIYAMSGASRSHNLITVNVSGNLASQLRTRPCEVYASDMRVKVEAAGLYTYPDVSVVCGTPQFEDADVDTLLNPSVIIEVLPRSTESYDRGTKFAHYRRLPSLLEYVLIAQERVHIDRYLRRGDEWVLTDYHELEEVLPIASIGCSLQVREIYSKVSFSGEDELSVTP